MGGKKGGGSRSPRIDKNTLNSAQKLKVVDLISSGEIAGFINGNEYPLKSVYLNDTPVQNEDGSMNHAGVQFEFNNGAIDQDYLPSLSSVDNSVSVGAQVEKKNPITRTVTNQQVTSVRVTVGVDALMRSTKEGDQLATSVDMSIQIIKNGEIYASEHMHLNEKGNQPFRLDFVFSKLPAAPFDIRCVRITEDSNDDMLRNKTYFFSYVESIDIKVRMPGSAVAMLQIDSQQFGSNNPTRNYGLKGCIVQVPSNYDPVARTYTGLWDRLFKPAFTNNPAWVLYDVLTADECLGEKFKDYRIDIDRLYELSKQCDVLVDDGKGGKEPRFVCNMVLFGGDASTVLDNICSIFFGTYSDANNQFTVQYDQKSDPVAVYNNSSVENGEFNYSYVPATELYNQVKYEYIDENDGYRTKIDEVSDEANIAMYGLRSISITAFGCTTSSQARRCALRFLITSLTENETSTFVLGAAGIRHEQHDIVKLADNNYAGAQIGGRIDSVDGNTITVDRELKNVKEFMINIDGSVKTFQVIKTIDAKTYQLNAEVNAVDYVQFVATLNNLEPRLFRCVHIEEDSEINKYTVTAIKHNPQKEAIVDKGAEYIEGNHSILNTLPHLSNGIVTTEGKAIILRWDSLETVGSENKYIVHLYNSTTLVRRIETKEAFVRLENLPQGNYTARIRAINELGQYSEELHISFSTTYEISGLRFTPIVFGIKLNWEVPELLTTDAHTEIWYSKEDDRENTIRLAKLPYPQNSYTLNGLGFSEEMYFWFRLVDTNGNQGEFTSVLKARSSDDSQDLLDALNGKITTKEFSKETIENITKEVVDDALEEIKKDVDAIINESTLIKDINEKMEEAELSIQILELSKISGDRAVYAETVVNKVSIENQYAEMIIQRISEVTADKQLAMQYLSLVAENENAKAALTLTQIARTTDNNAFTQEILSLTAAYLENSARVDQLTEATASEFDAQAKKITSLQAQVGVNKSSIYTLEQTTAELEKSTATRFSEVKSEIGLIDSDVKKNTASVKSLQETTIELQSSVAKDMTEVKAEIELVNDDLKYTNQSLSNLGDDVTGVKDDVKKNTASINTQSTAIANLDGTVKSQWTMTTETVVDGETYISGITSVNDGGKSEIIFQSDKIGFLDTRDKKNKPQMMFMIVDGVMGMNGDIIAKGTIAGESIKAKSTITAPHIEGGTFTGADGKFKVLENGDINISSDPKKNVGMKISADRQDVYGEDQKLKVRIGRLR